MANENKQTQTQTPAAPVAWNVMVRHSSFLLKSATITATGKAGAKAAFLDRVRQYHNERAEKTAGQAGLDVKTIQQAQRDIKAALDQSLQADGRGELSWTIRLQSEVDAERADIENRRRRTWGEPDEMPNSRELAGAR